MHIIEHFLGQLNAEHLHGGGGGSKLDLINRPAKPDGGITPNRSEVFKGFNYQFKS